MTRLQPSRLHSDAARTRRTLSRIRSAGDHGNALAGLQLSSLQRNPPRGRVGPPRNDHSLAV